MWGKHTRGGLWTALCAAATLQSPLQQAHVLSPPLASVPSVPLWRLPRLLAGLPAGRRESPAPRVWSAVRSPSPSHQAAESRCGVQPLACGHTCLAQCHDKRPPPPPELTKTARKKGFVRAPPKPLPTPCPPCGTLVERECLGRHAIHAQPCHRDGPYSCPQRCGRWLPCGNHRCERACHAFLAPSTGDEEGSAPVAWAGPFDADSAERSRGCGSCDYSCQVPRPEGCSHACPQGSCHPPPCPECLEVVHFRCFCGMTMLTSTCSELVEARGQKAEVVKSCRARCIKKIACGHRCAFGQPPTACREG